MTKVVEVDNNSTNCTTNADDLAAAAALQARLSSQNSSSTNACPVNDSIPSVSIDEGAHKYVLIKASTPSSPDSPSLIRTFVYSKRGADYHRNVAEYLVPLLERAGYFDIRKFDHTIRNYYYSLLYKLICLYN